nr:hypothetical protein [Tanacetum cinerariifolium]
ALHLAVVGRDAPRREQEAHHVHGFRRVGDEVEDALTRLAVKYRVGLLRVNQVGELDGIPDKEHFQVVTHEVPVAVFGVEFHREAAWVAQGFGRVATVAHRREAYEYGGLFAFGVEQLRAGVLFDGLAADSTVGLKRAVGTRTAGVHHTLGDALAVEVADFFDELVVLQRGRATVAHST